MDFQGKAATDKKRLVKHEENLKVEKDSPFLGGTSYSNGFLNWGSSAGYVTTKPQYYPLNVPFNARTSYAEAFKQPDGDSLRPKVTMDRNAR